MSELISDFYIDAYIIFLYIIYAYITFHSSYEFELVEVAPVNAILKFLCILSIVLRV